MTRGRSRWSSKSLRSVFPIRGERLPRPRFDGWYGTADQFRVRFAEDDTVELDGEVGSWKIDRGVLMLATDGWQCEGALDASAAYLLCSPEGRITERVQLELPFEPDG